MEVAYSQPAICGFFDDEPFFLVPYFQTNPCSHMFWDFEFGCFILSNEGYLSITVVLQV